MRAWSRWEYLARAPQLLLDIVLRGRYEFTYDLMPMLAAGMSVRKRANLLATGLNLLHRRARPWGWPMHAQLELTSFCNLRCPICPTGLGRINDRPKLMDMDLFEQIMAEVGPYLVTTSLWAWGEPLLHPRFADAVRICREHGVIPLFSTNGQTLSNERVLNDLIREPPTYLIVAIDGLTDETNTKYRAGAKLEPALQGVRRLARMKRERGQELPVMNMRFIVMAHNEHEVPHVTRFAAENGFDMLTIRSLDLRDTGEALHQRLVPHQERFRAYQYRHGQRVRRDDFVCHLAFFFPTVLTDGTVVTCDQDFNGNQAYGRVGEDGSFADIWWSDRAAEVRRTILRSPQAYSCCRDCPFADRATSACSLEAFDFRRGAGRRQAVGAEL